MPNDVEGSTSNNFVFYTIYNDCLNSNAIFTVRNVVVARLCFHRRL